VLERWDSDRSLRYSVKHRLIAREKALERNKVAAAAGSIRAANFVKFGGRRAYPTAEASLEAERQSQVERNRRASQADLDFRLEHATGCSHPGCPLAADVDVPRLLQHHHVDDTSKVGNVTDMHGEVRLVEVAKTRCLCIWHHYLCTRSQRGDKEADDAAYKAVRTLNALKLQVGCQHPLHSDMPHAVLVSTGTDDPLVHTFLDVSHTMRGGEHCRLTYGAARANSHLEDLASGKALIFCAFCHAMYTVCEMGKLNPEVPFSRYQFDRLKERRPAFVQHFEEATSTWGPQEWLAERRRLNGLPKKRPHAEAFGDGHEPQEPQEQ
jgi:hypothetical protein